MNKKRIHNIYHDFLGYSPITTRLYEKICAAWNLNAQEFMELRIGGTPSLKLNWTYCNELSKVYGGLLDVPGFKSHPFGGFLLDIDARLSSFGFLLPERRADKLITALRVYRCVEDARPFVLRTRKENICVAA